MQRRSFIGSASLALGGLVLVAILIVVELVATMLVYMYLNLYHLDTFGYLVRLARSVLDLMAAQLDFWLQGSANTAYATLIGELGPKSILLLLIGLVMSVIVRTIARLIGRAVAG